MLRGTGAHQRLDRDHRHGRVTRVLRDRERRRRAERVPARGRRRVDHRGMAGCHVPHEAGEARGAAALLRKVRPGGPAGSPSRPPRPTWPPTGISARHSSPHCSRPAIVYLTLPGVGNHFGNWLAAVFTLAVRRVRVVMAVLLKRIVGRRSYSEGERGRRIRGCASAPARNHVAVATCYKTYQIIVPLLFTGARPVVAPHQLWPGRHSNAGSGQRQFEVKSLQSNERENPPGDPPIGPRYAAIGSGFSHS